MGYDGTLKFDTKVDSSGFESGAGKIASLAGSAIGGATKVIGAAATTLAGLGVAAVKVGSDFEASMSNVAAISGATGSELDALTAKAQEMGSKTKFSASESADAFSYMAMAGWKTNDMLEGIEGIMNLAAASGADLATTSDIVTDALTGFGLSAKDSGHFADLMAVASSNANTNVELMGETFKYVAPVAGALGISAEDAAESIAYMANAGIKGSQAGTSFRSILNRIATDAGASSKKLGALGVITEELGVQVYDSSGNMRDWSDIVDECRGAWAGLNDEQKSNFGKQIAGMEGLSAWNALMNASTEDINKMKTALEDADGAAEEMAAIQLDNLQGQITILKSALEGFGINIYQEMDEPLKEVVKTANDMIGQLSSAFEEGGFEGLVSAAGDVLAQILQKVADAVPQFIEMAVSLVHSFCEGIKKAKGIGQSGATLVSALVKGIVSVAGDLATTAVFLITELVVSMQDEIPEIMQTGIDVVLSVADGIAEALPQLLPAAVNIITSIAQKIVENLPDIIAAAIDIIMAVIDGITQAMPQLLEAAVTVFSALIEAIPEIIDKLLDALPELITAIITFFTENFPTILQAAIDLFLALVEAIPEIIVVLGEHLPEIIAAIVTGIIEGVPVIIEAIIEAAATIAEQLPELLVSIIEAFGLFLASLLEPVGQFFVDVWTAIAEWFGELPGKLAEFFAGLIENVGEFFTNIITNAGEFFTTVLTNLETFLTDLPYKVGYWLGEVIGNIIKWGADVITWIAENVPVMIQNIVDFFAELPGNVQEWLTSTLENVVQWGADTLESASQAASDTLDAVVDFFSELPGNVMDHLSTTIDNVISFGSDLLDKGTQAAQDFFDGFIDIVGSIPGEMLDIGANIVSGVWNGIQSMASTFWNNVTSFFSGIVDGVKDTLGIASPSRVFAREVGQWIPPGVDSGVEKSMPDLVKNTKENMRQLVDEMQDTVDEESSSISFDKTGQQEYEQAQAERQRNGSVSVTGTLESDRPMEVHANLYIDKKKFAEEVTPAINHEMYKIDNSENNRGRGN